MMTAATMLWKRPYQSVSALSWTVIGVLIFSPQFAFSIGFSLSVCAVLGIVLFTTPCTRYLTYFLQKCTRREVSSRLCSSLSLVLCAQMATLPVLVARGGDISWIAILSNLLVAPFMTFSTVTGLGSLFLSWIFPHVGYALAWLSGMSTSSMLFIAQGCALLV